MSFDVPPMAPNELKQPYGLILAREPDPFKAALELFPNDMGIALWVNEHWRTDPEVLAHRDKERARIEDEESAKKHDLKREVWAMATNPNVEPKDRAVYMKLYAELIGAIEKPQTAQVINNNNVMVPRVIAMPTFNSDEEWEKAAQKQQQDLLNVATSRH